MKLSFDYNGFHYFAYEVSPTAVNKKAVCLDSVFYNEHAPTRARFMEPPQGTRSAHQRTMYPEFMSKKDREDASRFLDRLVERTDGVFIPNISHHWFGRIAQVFDQRKRVYTALPHQRNRLFILERRQLD